MPAFTLWLHQPPTALVDALTARLAHDGFRTETIELDRYAAVVADPGMAERLVEMISQRFVAHDIVALVQARGLPAIGWPDLVVTSGGAPSGADLAVDGAGHRAAAAAEQIIFEARERGISEPAEGEQSVVDRLRTIGYLG